MASKYKSGGDKDNAADDAMMKKKDHFLWFDHHNQHDESRWYKNVTELEIEMKKGKAFAEVTFSPGIAFFFFFLG